jgi:hypothetical protein
VETLFVPLFQNAVAVSPLEFVALEHGLVVSDGDGFGFKAHLRPSGEVFFLPGGGFAVRDLKRCEIGRVNGALFALAL